MPDVIEAAIWVKKKKGHAHVWILQGSDVSAVVDRRGIGLPPFITWNGEAFETVAAAKAAVEAATLGAA